MGMIVRFGHSTVVSAAITLGLPILLVEGGGAPAELAYALALATALGVNFAVLRWHVFASTGTIGRELAAYATAVGGFRLAEYAVFVLLHTILGVQYLVAIVVVQIAGTIAKFFTYRRLVFSPR